MQASAFSNAYLNISEGKSTAFKNNPCGGAEKLANDASFFSIILLKSSILIFPVPAFNNVATIALTIPRKKRLLFMVNKITPFTFIMEASTMEHL